MHLFFPPPLFIFSLCHTLLRLCRTDSTLTHSLPSFAFYLLIYLHSLIMLCKSYKTLRLRFGDSWWRSRATFYALVHKKQFEQSWICMCVWLFHRFLTLFRMHTGKQKGEKLTTLFTWMLVLLPHTHVCKSINLLFIHRFHQELSFASESIYFMASMWQL